jgi:hypothetical protein
VGGEGVYPLFETPLEPVDGVNIDFTATTDYVPGSVRVFSNGLLLRRDLEDGWWEFPPRRVRLKETPRVTDIIRLYYLPIP